MRLGTLLFRENIQTLIYAVAFLVVVGPHLYVRRSKHAKTHPLSYSDIDLFIGDELEDALTCYCDILSLKRLNGIAVSNGGCLIVHIVGGRLLADFIRCLLPESTEIFLF
jgi:hypothetical protein